MSTIECNNYIGIVYPRVSQGTSVQWYMEYKVLEYSDIWNTRVDAWNTSYPRMRIFNFVAISWS